MVERFNQGLKLAILAAYAANHDPEDEVNKYVASYRNMPHSVTGDKPSYLLFNRGIKDTLPRLPTKRKGKQHEEARMRDREGKEESKAQYDKKHRVVEQEIKEGDQAYR